MIFNYVKEIEISDFDIDGMVAQCVQKNITPKVAVTDYVNEVSENAFKVFEQIEREVEKRLVHLKPDEYLQLMGFIKDENDNYITNDERDRRSFVFALMNYANLKNWDKFINFKTIHENEFLKTVIYSFSYLEKEHLNSEFFILKINKKR
jgi:hypothetical protein